MVLQKGILYAFEKHTPKVLRLHKCTALIKMLALLKEQYIDQFHFDE